MKRIIAFLLLICISHTLFSQSIIGNWKGAIEINGQKLPIVFHFKDNNGAISGSWDSPLQKAMGLPFSDIRVKGDSIILDIKMIMGSYSGKMMSSDSIAGFWQQSGGKLPLNMIRSSGDTANITAADEEPPYPNEKEISITSSTGGALYGTLLSKNKNQKLAVIIAGSGPTDRNGNNPMGVHASSYRMLAISLDSQNIATFRYDKTGVGKSAAGGGQEKDLVFENSINDVINIINYLRDTMGFKNIYIIGHSEGSLIGMVAAQQTKVKGFISVAGPGRPFDVLIEEQVNAQSWPDSLKTKTAYIFKELKNGREVADVPEQLMPVFRKSVQPYLMSLLKYSPQTEISKLQCPVLILQGSCDMQVKVEDANNLHKASKKSTLDVINSMTHTLKDAGKDCADQQKTYTDSSLPLDITFVKDVTKFIAK